MNSEHTKVEQPNVNELEFSTAFDAASIGMALVDTNGRWLRANSSLCSMLGYEIEELLQKTFQDITHPDDLEIDLTYLKQLINDQIKSYQMEKRYFTKNGDIIWINLSASKVVNTDGSIKYFIAQIENITKRKQAEEALKISREEFSSAFEYASIGIALVGLTGEWLKVNNSLCNMLGYSNDEFLRTTFQDITHPEDLEIDLAYLQQLINDEISTYQMEKRYFTKKGEIIWINLSVSKVLNSDGSIRYFISQIENIHERKTAALILNAEKERFENVIEGTNAGTWEWNVQTGETVFNNRWAAIVGYTLSELEPISINTWLNLAHPDDLEESGKKLNECFEKKEAYYECECRMKHKNGHWVWVLDRGKVISWTPDGKPLMMFGTHSDITHQKETEFSLQESENKFRGIFNSTFQFIGFLATDGTLLEANNTALEFAGLQPQEVMGKKFWDCHWWQLSVHTQEKLKISIEQAASGKFIQYEAEIWDKNKKPQTILFNLKPLLNSQGKVTAIIPEGRLIQDIVDARKKILEKNTELQQFASNASHDLKEPVRMIKSFMEQLQKKYGDKLDDKARQYIHYATDGATRMNNYITDMLEYAKTGTHEVTKQQVDINSVLKDILALQASSIEKKEAQIKYDNLPVVTGYPTPIKMLFLNLITNALKFQNQQKKPVIHISANETEKYWEFTVSDNGIGIETENLENIFEMFRRLNDKTQFDGTGIGLATCKKVVELHAGEIWVNSRIGEGSKFSFTFAKYK